MKKFTGLLEHYGDQYDRTLTARLPGRAAEQYARQIYIEQEDLRDRLKGSPWAIRVDEDLYRMVVEQRLHTQARKQPFWRCEVCDTIVTSKTNHVDDHHPDKSYGQFDEHFERVDEPEGPRG